MSKLFCITDLIRFIMKEAEKLMKGSIHEDNLFIVHYALVLMISKETIIWMKEPLLVDAHEWIAGQDTLYWAPCM